MAPSAPPPPPLARRLVALALALALAALVSPASAARKIPASVTPISRDLYRPSDTLLSEIKALVARNPDRLTMDTLRAGNKGYSAEMLVVTFNHVKKTVHAGSKIKILLKVHCLPELWAAWQRTYHL